MEISNIYSDLKKSIRTVSVLGSCALIAACSGDGSQPVGTNSTPSHSLNTYFFQGHTTSSGNELWKSDGTSAGTTLVKEINTLSNSSSANFTEAGNTTFFTANNVIHGNELWKSDANGVSMVKDIHVSGSSNPRNLLSLNGKLYFIADDATSSSSLWESDGTSDGTIQIGTFTGVTNLTPMPDNSIYFTIDNYLWHYNGSVLPASPITPTVSMQYPSRLTAVGNQLYFSAFSSGFGTELWTSNGTDAGTFMVKDIRVGPSDFFGSYNQLFSVNGRLVFTNDSYTYSAFYVSDGTDPGTVQLMTNEATPRAITTYFNTYAIQSNSGYVFFTNPDDSYYLWRTDGTSAGTVRLNTAMFSYAYEAQTKADGTYVLQTQNGLMTSDGTASGTAQLIGNASAFAIAGNSIFYPSGSGLMVTDGTGPGVSIAPLNSTPVMYSGSTKIYLSYDDATNGYEPWISNGTSSGTVMLADINTSPTGDSNPGDPVAYKGALYFVASEGNDRSALWKSDGTENGTVKITPDDVYNINQLVVSGDKLYFTARDNTHGYEIWVSDGTTSGTHLFMDLETGTGSSDISRMTNVNGDLYFVDDNRELTWKTRGTVDSLSIASLNTPYSEIVPVGNHAYYTDSNETYGRELWVTDGTISGNHLVKDINPDGDSIYRNSDLASATIGNTLYFIATDGANGYELWKTDGSEANTQMVINLNAADDGVDYSDSTLVAWNGQIYLTAYSTDGNLELWKTDGTEAGTIQITTLGSNGGYITLEESAAMGNHLYFAADNGTDGTELWRTDGTAAGTEMLKNINTTGDSDPFGFQVVNNVLFFIANDGATGNELWKTDGTEAGTVLVQDVHPGEVSGSNSLTEDGYYNNDKK